MPEKKDNSSINKDNTINNYHKDRKYSLILIVIALILLGVFVAIVIESYYGHNLLFPTYKPKPIPTNMFNLAGSPQAISESDISNAQYIIDKLTAS